MGHDPRGDAEGVDVMATRKSTEQAPIEVSIDDLVAARRWHDWHQRNLRSKNKRVRARAQRLERKIQRLDREITEVLSRSSSRRRAR